MGNFNIKIALSKIKGAKVMDIKGNTSTKRCIVIPIDSDYGTVTDSYVTKMNERKFTNDVWLNLEALEMKEPQYGKTHILKEALSKEKFEHTSQEARRAMPIVGNLIPWRLPAPAQTAAPGSTPSSTIEDLPPANEDDW